MQPVALATNVALYQPACKLENVAGEAFSVPFNETIPASLPVKIIPPAELLHVVFIVPEAVKLQLTISIGVGSLLFVGSPSPAPPEFGSGSLPS